MEAEALSSLLTNLGSIVGAIITNAGKIFEVMNQYPIAWIGVGAGLTFTLIRFVRAIINF